MSSGPSTSVPDSQLPRLDKSSSVSQVRYRFLLPIVLAGMALRALNWYGIVLIGIGLQVLNWYGWGEDSTFRTFVAIYVLLPAMAFALIVWWMFYCGLRWSARFLGLVIAGAAAGLFFALVRIDGVDGVMVPKFSFRWTKSAEQRAADFLASQPAPEANQDAGVDPDRGSDAASGEPAREDSATNDAPEKDGSTRPAQRIEVTDKDWPRFRGANDDSIVRDVTIRTDWDQNPPKEVWRHPCGLGWSSFAVVGNRLYTQEQIGPEESVVCYDADNGKPLWRHKDLARLDTSLGGDGPRATPTVFDSRVYSLGGTGILNCLDAATGRKLWSADILKDAGIDGIDDAYIDWGMSGSPLVDEKYVYVNPGISKSKPTTAAVAAYDRATGKKVWGAGANRAGYASPVFMTLQGVRQVVVFDAVECAGYDPETGSKLWGILFGNDQGINVAQPLLVEPNSIFLSTGYGTGSIRFDVAHGNGIWSTTERWRLKNQFKLKFNDGIFRDGLIYGLDEGVLACLDTATGERKWRQGRYRYGEIVLVAGESASDDLLVVLTETGDLVLVKPSPTKPQELGKFKAINGTCWNHPVVNRGRIYVRSEEEMACYEVGLGK